MTTKDLKLKFVNELRLFFFYTLFFTLFFSAFTAYRTLILKAYDVEVFHYGYNFFEAVILSKIILLGQKLGLGEKFSDKPLIIPTLYSTVIFTIFVFVFIVFEHFVVNFFQGRSLTVGFDRLISTSIYEILARILVMLFVFILFFSCLQIGRVLGYKKLFDLFFKTGSQHLENL